jgi:putative restriction endonuclease
VYNSKPCLVLDKSKKYNIIRLKVKYDDGRIDNVLGDPKRYEILYRHGTDVQRDISQPVRQERIVEDDFLPKRKEKATTTRKSREDLYSHYTQLIMKINQAVVHGQKILAKPALLITILDAISNHDIQHNEFILNKWLEDKYNRVLSRYINTNTRLTGIEKPFWHLQSDNFWHLEHTVPTNLRRDYSPTKRWLIEHVKYAYFDNDLWQMLQDEVWRNKLRNFIIEHKLLNNSNPTESSEQRKKYDRDSRSEMISQQKFLITTSLNDLFSLGIITNRQLKHCYKKGLRTIGDVKNKIEYYHLTPDSTRFTKYTLDMWFGIVGLLNSNV